MNDKKLIIYTMLINEINEFLHVNKRCSCMSLPTDLNASF